MIERVIDGDGVTLAVIVRHKENPLGIQFYTEPSDNVQVGLMVRPAGYVVPLHEHTRATRTLVGTTEVLVVKRGRCQLAVSGKGVQYYGTELLPGDTAILLSGSHGIEFNEETEIIEVKQGPYLGPQDKIPARLWENGPTY